MPYELSHWKNPRSTIACKFKGNDMEYATHGAFQSMIVLAHLNRPVGDFSGLSVLDYGCGTGRIARPMTAVFGKVYGYDPVPECIEEGERECAAITFHNLLLTSNLTKVPQVDVAFSVSVIEHLSEHDAMVMIRNLKRLVRGETVLWYSVASNSEILYPYMSPAHREEEAKFREDHPKATIRIGVFDFNKTYRS